MTGIIGVVHEREIYHRLSTRGTLQIVVILRVVSR